MLAAAAARLRDRHDLVWVDMGGGTGVSAGLYASLFVPGVCQRSVRTHRRRLGVQTGTGLRLIKVAVSIYC